MSRTLSDAAAAPNTAPIVVVYPRGQLSELDKDRMKDVGIIAIEADNPDQVKQLHFASPVFCTGLNGDLIVKAALQAIADQSPSNDSDRITTVGYAAHAFVKSLAAAMASEAIVPSAQGVIN